MSRRFAQPTTVLCTFAVLVGMAAVGCVRHAPVTTASLLVEMTDLNGMAEFPSPGYTCKQASSYDRKSKSPDEDWFANGDCGQFIRTEETAGRTEHVMMEADGPGAIVRIWSANPRGVLRIYLDRDPEPVIEAPMAEFLGGRYPGVPVPIAGERSRGWNSYFPIPYATHCKVTSDDEGFYYHVNYRTYAPGTPVVSFSGQELLEQYDNVKGLARAFGSPMTLSMFETMKRAMFVRALAGALRIPEQQKPSDVADPPIEIELNAGDAKTLLQRQGPAAIRGIFLEMDASTSPAVLRQVVLQARFDGEETVRCPLGDFFGSAPGMNSYESLPLGVMGTGRFYCLWVMPFERSGELRLLNWSAEPIRAKVTVWLDHYEWTDRSMHFHAGWRGEYGVSTRPKQDWNYLHATGQGVFAGAAFSIANPVKAWWGEGDEKIYVDGESFPSHFGTGTEDYYGYAWCNNQTFTHAYHNQLRCDGPGNYGYTSVNRFHILDRIPFTKDFHFDMELWHWAECKVDMAVVTYWYGRPGARDDYEAFAAADLRVADVPPYAPPRVAGVMEGEDLRVIETTAVAAPQAVEGCSGETHLWWHGGQRVGDRLVLAFDAPASGRYFVHARFVKARDYGVHRLHVNGQTVPDTLDLYNDRIAVSDEMRFGPFDLSAEDNRLVVEVTGANEKAVKAYMFGLDYLRLEPVP